MSRDSYIAASERVLATAKKRLATHEGDCKDCRWFGRYSGAGDHDCDNPIVILASQNRTKKYDRSLIRTCGQQRDKLSMYGDVVCGPDGTLFEPRRSFWQWLFTND